MLTLEVPPEWSQYIAGSVPRTRTMACIGLPCHLKAVPGKVWLPHPFTCQEPDWDSGLLLIGQPVLTSARHIHEGARVVRTVTTLPIVRETVWSIDIGGLSATSVNLGI